jgi:ABC-type multidrug transport system ATPase subunit
MEEAEALCNRIGIMADGALRCLGNSMRLKELYASGFRVYLSAPDENLDKASKYDFNFVLKNFDFRWSF